MQALSTNPAIQNGSSSLPALLIGKVQVLGQAFQMDMLPILSDNTGNTRWESVQYFEVDDRKEGIALLKSFAAKYEGTLLASGSVHRSDIKQKVGRGGTAYTTGGNDTVTHVLDEQVVIAGLPYRVTANATLTERSRNKVKYLCVTVSMKVQRVGSGFNGPKTKGEIVPVTDF